LFLHKGLQTVAAFWLSYSAAAAFMMLFLAMKSEPKVMWEWRLVVGMLFNRAACMRDFRGRGRAATRLTLVQAAIGTGAFFVVGHAVRRRWWRPSGTQITT